MIDTHHGWNSSLKPLIYGFIGSLLCLLGAFFLATNTKVSGNLAAISLVALGGVQALLQLVFFLHLGVEEKPRWSLMTFLFMLLIMVILIGGSLWIMYNLDYNMMLNMQKP